MDLKIEQEDFDIDYTEELREYNLRRKKRYAGRQDDDGFGRMTRK